MNIETGHRRSQGTGHHLGDADRRQHGHRRPSLRQAYGIDDARGDLLPEAKLDAIKEMQKRYGATGMTGDGINDARALAQADIGFCHGCSGNRHGHGSGRWVIAMTMTCSASRRDSASIQAHPCHSAGRTSPWHWHQGVFLVMAVVGTATMWTAVFADMGRACWW